MDTPEILTPEQHQANARDFAELQKLQEQGDTADQNSEAIARAAIEASQETKADHQTGVDNSHENIEDFIDTDKAA